jgi:hypothetical protein
MFETGPYTAEYENVMGYEQPGYGPGEYEQPGYGPGEYEQSGYAGEYKQPGYWSGEYEQPGYWSGEYEQPGYWSGEYEQPGYGSGEYEQNGYGSGEYEQNGYGSGEYEQNGYGPGEYEGEEEDGEGENEERFLPLIPIAGKVLGGLLGGLLKEGEYEQLGDGLGEYEGEYEDAGEGEDQEEPGEAEEQFLDRVFIRVLGREAEYEQPALSPEQEEQYAAQLMETQDEEELARIIGRIVNTVGRAVQGVRGAVNSPQGQALINAITPLARATLPPGGATALLETEQGELDQEEGQYETARRIVALTSDAAQGVAAAPPGAPPQMVGELSVIRAARNLARPLFNRALRMVSPLARRYFGRRYHGFRRGYRYGRPYRGYGGRRWGYRPGRYWGYRHRRYSPGYRRDRGGFLPPAYPPYAGPAPAPGPEAGAEPGLPPPQPGYRWVAVPIGAPEPTSMPPEPPPPPAPEPASSGSPASAPSPEPAAAAQGEIGFRRSRRYRGYGGSRGYRRYGYGGYGGGGSGGGDGDDGGDGTDGGSRPGGRWIRRGGRIIVLGA